MENKFRWVSSFALIPNRIRWRTSGMYRFRGDFRLEVSQELIQELFPGVTFNSHKLLLLIYSQISEIKLTLYRFTIKHSLIISALLLSVWMWRFLFHWFSATTCLQMLFFLKTRVRHLKWICLLCGKMNCMNLKWEISASQRKYKVDVITVEIFSSNRFYGSVNPFLLCLIFQIFTCNKIQNSTGIGKLYFKYISSTSSM